MPIRLSLIERLAFYRLGVGPVPLLDAFGAFSFHILVAGMRLRVFDSCIEPCDSAQLSADLAVDADSLAVLLRALEAIGYIEEKEEGWVNTATTNRWLVADSRTGVRAGVEYWARLLEGPLERPDQNLSNPPSRSLYDWLADDQPTADIFQDWMVEIAGLAGAEIIRKIPERSVGNRLLDVGGGHGWYSIQLCRRNPDLEATIVDHSSATRTTQRRIQDAGLGGRISIVNADYTNFETSEPFETVLMFNILHGHKGPELDDVLSRSRNWVGERGQLLIVEQFPDTPGLARTTSALLALAYDQLLDGTGHEYSRVRTALANAGYHTVKRKRMRVARGTSLVEARP